MNRNLVVPLILLALLSGRCLHALEGGIKIGLQLSSLTRADEVAIPDTLQLKGKTGLTAGILYRFPLFGGLSIQPEVLYVEKNYHQTIQGDSDNFIARFRISTIELPLMLKYRFHKSLYLAAGPYLAFRVSGRVRKDDNTPENPFTLDSLRKRDRGWAAAIGLILDDVAATYIEFRYQQGNPGLFPQLYGIDHHSGGFTISLVYGI